MRKNKKVKRVKRQYSLNRIFPVLIFIAVLSMSVGFAALTSIDIGFSGQAVSRAVGGIYITETSYFTDHNANLADSKIVSAYQTNMDSKIVLSNSDNSSSITYNITFYNSANYAYRYDGVDFLLGSETYSNEDITFLVTGLEIGDTVLSKEFVTLSITFHYVDGVVIDNNVLDSILNFKFAPVILYDLIEYYSDGDDSNIDFSMIASENDTGIFVMNNSKNDEYPIYYYRGNVGNNNVIFGGFCWQIVRTTDTGGVKLMYNGPAVNNQCLTSRGSVFVGYGRSPSTQTLSSQYFYGTSYTFDSSTSKFQLAGDLVQETWSSSTSESLKGKFTCKVNTADGNCSTLYQVADYSSETQAITLSLASNSYYGYVAQVQFNSNNNNNNNSLADVGYMFGTRYNHATKSTTASAFDSVGVVYANDVTWDGTKYVLSDDRMVSEGGWSADRTEIATKYHYTCYSKDGVCGNTVYYIYYFGSASTLSHFSLTNGKKMTTIMDEMFSNTKSSIIKYYVDNWYQAYMVPYTSFLEDIPWCNERSFIDGALKDINSNGINPLGDNNVFAATWRSLTIYQPDVKCINPSRDGFSVSTSVGNGLLEYPVGLVTSDELLMAGANTATGTTNFSLGNGSNYWTISPGGYNNSTSNTSSVTIVLSTGQIGNAMIKSYVGVRPVISLLYGTEASSGDGTVENPYIIG